MYQSAESVAVSIMLRDILHLVNPSFHLAATMANPGDPDSAKQYGKWNDKWVFDSIAKRAKLGC